MFLGLFYGTTEVMPSQKRCAILQQVFEHISTAGLSARRNVPYQYRIVY